MKDNSKARNSPDQLCTRKAPPQKDGEKPRREKGSYLEGRSSVFSWMLILFLCQNIPLILANTLRRKQILLSMAFKAFHDKALLAHSLPQAASLPLCFSTVGNSSPKLQTCSYGQLFMLFPVLRIFTEYSSFLLSFPFPSFLPHLATIQYPFEVSDYTESHLQIAVFCPSPALSFFLMWGTR